MEIEPHRTLTIGFLGGMSWESTAEYYRLANEITRDRLGGFHSAKCVLYSVDFAEIETLQVAGAWDQAGEALADAARRLEAAGAEFLVLCTNTMHIVVDHIVEAINIPLLDIRDVVASAIHTKGVNRVGLLATAYTMQQSFYRDHIASHGLDVVVPNADDQATVHQIIFDELCLGIVTENSKAAYQAVIDRLVADGCQGVILGCTEIEMLISQADSPVPVFPSTRLHVEAALDKALGR